MTGVIKLIDGSFCDEINALRQQEYAKAGGFAVDLSTLKWQRADDDSYVLAVLQEGNVVATMRGEVIADLPLLERKLECPWDYPLTLAPPFLLLSRAATLSTCRSRGFNLLMRYWFLRFAMEREVPFVLGTFVADSPRETSLRDMGYQFFENKLGWQQSTYRSLRPVHVVALDMRSQGRRALAYCEEQAETGLKDYPFMGSFPDIRFVKDV